MVRQKVVVDGCHTTFKGERKEFLSEGPQAVSVGPSGRGAFEGRLSFRK
jgi:hypothetical protein